MRKIILCIFFAVCMVLTLLPVSAIAEAAALEPIIFDFCNGEPTVSVKPNSDLVWEETNYAFAGWYTAPNGEGTKLSDNESGIIGTYYYAKWTNNGKTVRTSALDLTDISESKLYGSTKSGDVYINDAAGWTWYAAQTTVENEAYAANTLVLYGQTIHTAAATALKVPDSTTIVLAAGTTNTVRSGYTDSDSEDVFTYGIYGEGLLNIKGSGTLNAFAGTAAYTNSDNYKTGMSYGIYGSGPLDISDATVSSYGGFGVSTDSDNRSCGIYSNSTIKINGGSITGKGRSGNAESFGIVSKGNMEIKGGTVIGEGGSGIAYQSIGIAAKGNLSIIGGTVTGTGGELIQTGDTASAGFIAEGVLSITNGNITAKSGSAVTSVAISAAESLTVGSTENPATIANATNGSSDITSSTGDIAGSMLFMSGTEAVGISFAKHAITANAATNGSYTVKVDGSTAISAQSGDTVTITPTTADGYELDAISVYKTSDESTTVTVTNGSFTMPAYAVTVSVTFREKSTPQPAIEITGFDVIGNVSAGIAGSTIYANAAAVIAALPSIATANVNTVTIPVTTWVDTDGYNPAVAGSYTFTAILGVIPSGYANTGNYMARVEVVVAAPSSTPAPDNGNGSINKEDNKGRIIKEQQQDESIPETNLNNTTEELKGAVFTAEELSIIEAGEDAKVILKVTDISDSVSEADKKLIAEKLNGDVSVMYIDLSLYKKVGNGTETKITETSNKISISIKVPAELRSTDMTKNRTYQIVRIHDGEVTIIEGTYDVVTGLFTFETDRFSTYALTYKDTNTDTNTGGNENIVSIKKDFFHLRLTAKASETSQKLTYTKISGADGYIIYGAPCGVNNKLAKLADVSETTTSYNHKGLKKATYYKYQVQAYRIINGKKVIIAASRVIHSVTISKTYANPTKVVSETSTLILAVGKTKKVTCQVVLPVNKKMKNHTDVIRYETTNNEIATVSRNGKIKAISKGTCYIYAYAQNGVYKKMKITIK